MAYEQQEWKPGKAGGTPVSADRLNHIEQGIAGVETTPGPQGPKGRFHILNPWSHSIFTHAADPQAAKDFLRWLMDPKQASGW